MAKQMKSKQFIFISLGVDLIIASSKFVAAAVTGSSSMMSEGIHSIIDAISQVLLLWGFRASRRLPDSTRPFGYGKELYFWSFIVSLIIFVVGGCISFYEGLIRLQRPGFEDGVMWNYAILGIAFIFNLISLISALKVFNAQRKDMPFWKAVVATKDPSTIIVILGDIGDLLGLFIAFLGVFLGRYFHDPYYDAVASMLIGIVLIVISGFLSRESKSLLMGETTSRSTLRQVIKLTEADETVVKVKKHFSMYMAPEEILLHMNTIFKKGLTTEQITDAIERITKLIQKEFPRMKQIFIEPVAK